MKTPKDIELYLILLAEAIEKVAPEAKTDLEKSIIAVIRQQVALGVDWAYKEIKIAPSPSEFMAYEKLGTMGTDSDTLKHRCGMYFYFRVFELLLSARNDVGPS